MKILITAIVISIILIMSLIILNKNIYFSEDFANNENKFNQYTIEDLIDISYIPNNPNEKEEISEYDVIDLYKKILERSPTPNEIRFSIILTKDKLTEELYNSFEYDKLLKVQNNNANNYIEGAIAKRNLIKKITEIYNKVYSKEIPDKMIIPLRDCYIHLRNNTYLFTAMIESKTYPKFENEILTSITLTKKNLLELFNSHFNLLELKLLAQDKINNISTINTSNYTKIIDDLDYMTKKIPLDEKININLTNKLTFDNIKEGYTNNDDSVNELKKIIKIRDPEKIKEDVINTLPKDSEVYVRVYDPINYKQTYNNQLTNSTSKNLYRPPICTSLGQPQLTTPIFTESKLLFQGTEIDKAFEETQVGSIMPKFTYREYQDIRIQ